MGNQPGTAKVTKSKLPFLSLILAIALMFTVILPTPAMASFSLLGYQLKITTIEGANGTALPAHVYIPTTTAPAGGFPAVIFIHSWSMNQLEYEAQMIKFAKNGYIALSYDCRGWGLAGGSIGTAGSLELQDVSKVVDWVIAHTPVNPAKIGSVGVSYGGGQSLLALNFEPRIKTVVAMSCWTDLCEGLAPDDSAKWFWASVLCGTAAFRAEPEMFTWLDSFVRGVNIETAKEALRTRSASTYLDNINERQPRPPVFIVNGINDDLFTTRQIVNFYERYQGPKKLMLANGIHATSEAPGLLGLTSTIWNDTLSWFDYWLRGKNNGIMDQPRFSVYQDWTNSQGTYTDWPLPTNNASYYLSSNGLGGVQSEATTADVLNVPSAATSGIPALTPLLDTLNIPLVGVSSSLLKLSPGVLCYDSNTLNQAVTVVGTPKIHALVQPNASCYQLNFLIYDVNQLGISTLVAHSPITIREGVADQPKEIDLQMNVVSHKFTSGHRIRLVVSSQDPTYVLPMTNAFDVSLLMGGSSNTRIDLPVLP